MKLKNMFFGMLAAAALSLVSALAPAPAQAQVWTEINNATGQVGIVGAQVNGAVANAASSANNAVADALSAAIGNDSAVDNVVNSTSYHLAGFGVIGTTVNNATGQVFATLAQVNSSAANAASAGIANAKATSVAIANTSAVKNAVASVTSRH